MVVGQQGPRVGEHDRVVVHVDDPGRRVDPLGDLMGVVGRRDAGPDVEELVDPGLACQELHCSAEESSVLHRCQANRRERRRDRVTGGPVGDEVVLPPSQ